MEELRMKSSAAVGIDEVNERVQKMRPLKAGGLAIIILR